MSPPRSFVSFTLFAGPGVLFVALPKKSKPSIRSRIGYFKKKKSTITRVTANFSVHYMYEDSSVQDEFQYSVFIACHVN